MPNHILLTGGAGYIGSHTCVLLIQAGYEVTILDNLSNSSEIVLDRICQITGVTPRFILADITDLHALTSIFRNHKFDAVIHFAGLKSVGESTQQPLKYFQNNITGSINLLSAMAAVGIKKLVFSSSATVYGSPKTLPIEETAQVVPTNPYGRTKIIVEEILSDLSNSDPSLKIACLRYFNPIGAHPSGLIGETPQGTPNNLMPYISQVAVGKLEKLSIFGSDYPTPDGTGIRDYIHVMDLAEGHVAALQSLERLSGLLTVNLGTGKGYSVLEVVETFQTIAGVLINYTFAPRRVGDIAACYADPSLAERLFGWKAERSLTEMCRDTWNWQRKNPGGY